MDLLTSLPKDVLTYILSIVVYDVFLEIYHNVELYPMMVNKVNNSATMIGYMTQFNFYRRYSASFFAPHAKNLALVHPLFCKILRSATRTEGPMWAFHPQFFGTLLDQETRTGIQEANPFSSS